MASEAQYANTHLDRALEQFWLVMTDLYGGSFVNQFGVYGSGTSKTWLQVLGRDGIDPQTVALATAWLVDVRMKTEEGRMYAPNFPVLQNACQVVMQAVPDRSAIRDEIIAAARNWRSHSWTSVYAYAVASHIGAARIRHMSLDDLDRRIATALVAVGPEVRAGRVKPPQPDSQPALPKPARDSAVVQDHLRKLHSLVDGGSNRTAAAKATATEAPVEYSDPMQGISF